MNNIKDINYNKKYFMEYIIFTFLKDIVLYKYLYNNIFKIQN
jgi:hypothetical protein